jgi:hypothetical protein
LHFVCGKKQAGPQLASLLSLLRVCRVFEKQDGTYDTVTVICAGGRAGAAVGGEVGGVCVDDTARPWVVC